MEEETFNRQANAANVFVMKERPAGTKDLGWECIPSPDKLLSVKEFGGCLYLELLYFLVIFRSDIVNKFSDFRFVFLFFSLGLLAYFW